MLDHTEKRARFTNSKETKHQPPASSQLTDTITLMDRELPLFEETC